MVKFLPTGAAPSAASVRRARLQWRERRQTLCDLARA